MNTIESDSLDSETLLRILLDALTTSGGYIADCKSACGVSGSSCLETFDYGNSMAESNRTVGLPSATNPITTVMIRNIPKKCTQRLLLADVVANGFESSLDFMYLPTDISTGKNLGYAFVNFVQPMYAERFRDLFHKRHLSCMRGSRAGLSVSFAVIQGLEANVKNVMKNASVHRIRNPEYLPLVLCPVVGKLTPCCIDIQKRRSSVVSTQSSVSQSSITQNPWDCSLPYQAAPTAINAH